MADQAMTQDLGDIEIEATRKGGLNGKKLDLFVILPVLLLVGGLAGAYFAGLLDPLLGKHDAPAEPEPAAAQTVFFDLPQMRSEERRVGDRRDRTVRCLWSPYH